jgi:hypothetical protein
MMSKTHIVAAISKSNLPALYKSFSMLILGQISETDIRNALVNAPKMFQQIQRAGKPEIVTLLQQSNLPIEIADLLFESNGHQSE